MDPLRLSKTMAFLLRHRPDIGNLEPDNDGWVNLEDLCIAVSRLMGEEVRSPTIRALVDEARVSRFEIDSSRIRATNRPRRSSGQSRQHPRTRPPDILYHACTAADVEAVRRDNKLFAGKDKYIYLSNDDAHAWRVAHRLVGSAPRVLVVDATRARRHGVRFFRNRRNGLYLSTPIPASDILNLQPGYAEQHSAGGFPVTRDAEGRLRVALIKVNRRSGSTWEVAKGKLEPGETPEATAVREVQEEMGLNIDLRITRYLDTVRYGFLAPGGMPRLKSVYLYLMEPLQPVESFSPRAQEGIADVRWFTVEEAVRAVTHTSLQPVMRQLREVLRESEHEIAPQAAVL